MPASRTNQELDLQPSRGLDLMGRVGIFLVFVCLAASAIHKIVALDVWHQLRTGHWILRNGVPHIDRFSYGFPGRPWLETRWLYCVIAEVVHERLGLNALILAKLSVLIAVLVLLLLIADRRFPWVSAIGLAIFVVAAQPRFMVRPELATFLFLALFLVCLQRFLAGGTSRWLSALPFVQVVWCNTHSLWVLGPALLWLALWTEMLQGRFAPRIAWLRDTTPGLSLRPLVLAASATTLATLATPYFLGGVLYQAKLFGRVGAGEFLGETIVEFHSPFSSLFFGLGYGTLTYVAVVGLGLAGFALNCRRLTLWRATLFLSFLLFSLLAVRNVALLGLVTGFVTILNLSDYARDPASRGIRPVRSAAAIAVLIYCLVMIPAYATDWFYRASGSSKRFGFGVAELRAPIDALAFARQAGLPFPVLNVLGDGGYVIFEGGERSAYVDGRLEVYGPRIIEQTMELFRSAEDLAVEAERVGAKVVLLSNRTGDRAKLSALERSPLWVPVYFDASHLLYLLRTEETLPSIRRYAIDWRHPVRHTVIRPRSVQAADWLDGLWPKVADHREFERLGSLLVGLGSYDQALPQFEEAVRRYPTDSRSRMFLGLLYRGGGREAEARALLTGGAAKLLQEAGVQILAGQIALGSGRPALAIDSFHRARELGAAEPDVSLRLARAALASERLEEAASALKRITAAYPQNPEGWNLSAVLAVKQGDAGAAIAHFEKSLSMMPGQRDVLEALSRLKAAPD